MCIRDRGNGVDPFSTIEKYGSDPLRWYMITNSSPWDNLKFDVDGIEEVRRKFFGTLYNTYSFFSLYANVDGFEYKEADVVTPLSMLVLIHPSSEAVRPSTALWQNRMPKHWKMT